MLKSVYQNGGFYVGKYETGIEDGPKTSGSSSIAYFDIELSNKSIIGVKAYDDTADLVYRKYKINQTIIIEGKIRTDGVVEIRKNY